MNNPFKISRIDLRNLLNNSRRDFSRKLFIRMKSKYGSDGIAKQLDEKKGELIDEINSNSKKLSLKKENVEIITALSLSDFYFPRTETEITFELKKGVKPDSISKYNDLVSALEDYTHIDCQIEGEEKKLFFQIKRYPQQYLGDSSNEFLNWFSEDVIGRYGDMEGTILVIIIQPSDKNSIENPTNLGELIDKILGIKDQISFDEVAFIYNDSIEKGFTLLKILPNQKRLVIPLELGLARLRGDA